MYPLSNKAFVAKRTFNIFDIKDNILLYDAIFARDFADLQSAGSTRDSTIFVTGASKNGANPSTEWETSYGGVLSKNDIVDVYAHVRRMGSLPDTGNLWIDLGLSTLGTSGSRFVDFELFQRDITRTSNGFTGSGPDEGHSTWEFDTSNKIIATGDMIIGFEANGSSVLNLEVRIWVKKTDFVAGKTMGTFTFGSLIEGGSAGSTYGYADITVPSSSVYGAGSVGTSTKAPPWHTISSSVGDSMYGAGNFVEAAMNLTNLGIDPALEGLEFNLCQIPFSKLIVKSRTSASFSSVLKDFAGPYRFVDVPILSGNIIKLNDFSCEDTSVLLKVSNVKERVFYRWETSNGLFLDNNNNYSDSFVNDTSVRVLRPGTYYLVAAPLEGCDIDTIDVITIHAPPCAVDDNMGTTYANNIVTYNVLNNSDGTSDTDIENDIDTSSLNNIGLLQPKNGTISINRNNGQITYIPNPNWIGNDTFEYQICDKNSPALCDIASVIVTVIPDPITAINDINATWLNTPVSGNVTTNDIKNIFKVLVVDTTPISNVKNDLLSLNNDGSYTYTPNNGFTGLDSFEYTVCDTATPINCDNATAYITVDSLPNLNINNAVVANNDHFITLKDSSISNTVVGNDYDPDGNSFTVNPIPLDNVNNGTLILNSDGTFIYTPNISFEGTDTFTYAICDNGMPSKCDTAMAVIQMIANDNYYNDPPIAIDDYVTTDNSNRVSGNFITNDYDLDTDSFTFNPAPIVGPSNGSIVINSDGTFTYTPNPDFVGTDQVVYEICDTATPTLCARATLYITISEGIKISGTVFHDYTGLANGVIDGPGIGILSGSRLFAFLIDSSGVVVDSTVVNPSSGAFRLLATKNSIYSVVISTTEYAIGATGPNSSSYPISWVNVGEDYGTNNSAGSGIETGNPNGKLAIQTSTLNIANIEFSVESRPIAWDKSYNIDPDSIKGLTGFSDYTHFLYLNSPSGTNDTILYSGITTIMPGEVAGRDLEEGYYNGGTGTYADTVVFLSLPDTTNSILAYINGGSEILLVLNPTPINPSYQFWNISESRYEIPNFDATKLAILFKMNYQNSDVFTYSYKDTAGMLGISATYTISYVAPLLINMSNFDCTNDPKGIKLNWTLSNLKDVTEIQVLKSKNGNLFYSIHAITEIDHQKSDQNFSYLDANIEDGSVIYRIDVIDGNRGVCVFSDFCSKQVNIPINAFSVTARPNPTSGPLQIVLKTPDEGSADVTIMNQSGRIISESHFKTNSGINSKMLDLSSYSGGIYNIHISWNGLVRVITVMHHN